MNMGQHCQKVKDLFGLKNKDKKTVDGLKKERDDLQKTKTTLKNIQLDWSSETDTLKTNLPRDQEGYDGFEYTDEILLTRRIQWCVDSRSTFIFGVFLNNNFPNNDNGAWIPTQLDAPCQKL